MKIMDEVQKRNFRREVQRKSFIFNKSEVPDDMKVIFCFLYMRRRKINLSYTDIGRHIYTP